MGELRNVKLDEFSLVRGEDVRPANPEAVAAFYKTARKKEKETNMPEGTVTTNNQPAAPPAVQKRSLAVTLAKAVRDVLAKAKTTTSSTYTSTLNETIESTPDPAETEQPVVIVVQDTAPAAATVEKTEPAAPVSIEAETAAVVKALAPITEAIEKFDSRLAKIESASSGSRAIGKATMTNVTDNGGGAKFPEFSKFLQDRSGLTAGQRLTKATLTSSGWTYGLKFNEAQAFIDYIVDQSVALKLCRTVTMPNPTYNIDKIGLGSKVLVKGTPGVDPGDTVSLNGPSQVRLTAQEVIGIVSIGDDTLEDNIEGEAFVQHLLGMIARSAANELEEMAFHADTAVPDAGILDRLDGWYKLAKAAGAHVIDATTLADRYWPGDSAKRATLLLKSLPTKYRRDLAALRFLMHPDAYLDFNDMISEKGYTDAFASITGIRELPVRGITQVKCPMIHTDMTVGGKQDGTFVMLTNLQNLIFGIHREIRLEPYRQPRKRATDYVITMRCAAQIENGDAISLLDNAAVKPAAE